MNSRVLLVLFVLAGVLAALVAWIGNEPTVPALDGATAHAAADRAESVVLDEAPPARATRSETFDASAAAVALLVRVVDPVGGALDHWQVLVDEVRDDGGADPLGPCAALPPGALPPTLRGRTHVIESRREQAVPIPPDLLAAGRCLLLRARATRSGNPPRFVESDALVVDSARRGTVELVVFPPTLLVVRLTGARPSGDLDYLLTALGGSRERGAPAADRQRTVDSPVTFRVTPGVEHLVHVSAGAEDFVEAHAAPLARGDTAEVELAFPRGLLVPPPADYAEVALTGRIVDACGDAGLWAAVDGGPPISIRVQSDGRFELVAARGKDVELHAAGGELEARFDPEVSTHAFGTRDVEVRCLASAPRVDVEITIESSAPESRLGDAWFQLRRQDGDRLRTKSFGSQPKNTFRARVPALADLECVVYAKGHRDRVEFLFPAGAPRGTAVDGEAGVPFVRRTIVLEPGFRREFRAIHCSEHTPVPDAVLSLDGRLLGITDARGELVVELAEWPGRILVEARGFESSAWPPHWQTPIPATSLRLCPAD